MEFENGQQPESPRSGDEHRASNFGICCEWSRFGGYQTAQGYCIHGMGRGAIYMATVFLSTALIFLASEEVGCVEPDPDSGETVIVEDCDRRVYGAFRPAALVTNIATIAGVLVALSLPVIGAIMDYTPHRWTIGATCSALLILTEIIQVGTTSDTWFAMAILEAVSGLLFEVQVTASIAYLPEMAREVGEEIMNTHMTYFLLVEAAVGQIVYVILVVAVSTVFDFGDVGTAQFAQGLVAVWSAIGFYFGWKLMPKVPATHSLTRTPPADTGEIETKVSQKQGTRNLLLVGFVQNWNTFKHINKEYKNSLRWFLLGCIFGEAGAGAFLTVAVIFLTEHLGLSATEVGVFFIVGLVSLALSYPPAQYVTKRTNPNISWRLSMIFTCVVCIVGAVTLNRDNVQFSYLWGFASTVGLGWYYQAQYIYITMIIPKDQEAEIAGFFNYCRIILSWLPPLMFSLLVEANVSQSIGIIVVSSFFVLGAVALSFSAPWDEVLRETSKITTAPMEPSETKDSALAEEGKEVGDDNDIVDLADEPVGTPGEE